MLIIQSQTWRSYMISSAQARPRHRAWDRITRNQQSADLTIQQANKPTIQQSNETWAKNQWNINDKSTRNLPNNDDTSTKNPYKLIQILVLGGTLGGVWRPCWRQEHQDSPKTSPAKLSHLIWRPSWPENHSKIDENPIKTAIKKSMDF